MELVSVIIPIYNAEQYLSRCLKSIIDQTYTNLEILLVNDGSTDRSEEICMKYADSDSRFRYFNQDNAGVSAARNVGLRHARGEYVTFVDSDDWLADDHISSLEKAISINKADVSICGYCSTDGNEIINEVKPENDILFDRQTLAREFWTFYDGTLWNSPWNKMYLRSKILSEFDSSMSCGEDMKFNMQYLKETERIAIVPKASYNYFVPVSTGVKYPKNNAKQCFVYSDSVREFLASSIPEEEYIDKYNAFLCCNICRDACTLAIANPMAEAKKMIEEFLDNPEFVKVIDGGAWKGQGKKYEVVGRLLSRRMINTLILSAKILK